MLVSRTYRNNLGYQIDVDRPHPIFAWELQRFNRNYYDYDGYNVRVDYNKGGDKGLQYGGADCPKQRQMGSGVDPQTIYKALQMMYTGAKVIPKIYASKPATMLKNTYGKMINPGGNWRPGFAGEKHLMSKKGLTYNWCGPGTNVEERLKRGDQGLDKEGLDLTCKIHDIDYHNARNWEDVKKADKKFIENIDKTQIGPKSKKFIKGLFKGKLLAEKVGLIKQDQFTSFPSIQDEIPPIIQEVQPTINVSGQGILFRKGRDPARKLKNKIKKYRNKKKTDKLMGIAFSSIKKRLNNKK